MLPDTVVTKGWSTPFAHHFPDPVSRTAFGGHQVRLATTRAHHLQVQEQGEGGAWDKWLRQIACITGETHAKNPCCRQQLLRQMIACGLSMGARSLFDQKVLSRKIPRHTKELGSMHPARISTHGVSTQHNEPAPGFTGYTNTSSWNIR